MKISRKSWHYKLRNLWKDWYVEDNNLCRYFWGMVGGLLKLLAVGIVIIYCISLITLGIYKYFTQQYLLSNSILVVAGIACCVLPPLAIHYFRKFYGRPKIIGENNILREYVRAKKSKICPLIEYVD